MRSLGDDLFEVVFEHLDESTAMALLRLLLGFDVEVPSEPDRLYEGSLESLTLRTGITLGDVHVRLLRNDQSAYDVELNFRLRQASAPSKEALFAALYDFAAELAEASGAEMYFAGLEPASDEDTRLFTGKERGPYGRT